MDCPKCGMSNPQDTNYCGYCGAMLKTVNDVPIALIESAVEQRVATVLGNRFKEQKLVEFEIERTALERISSWAKLLGFFVGIPVVLLGLTLAIWGISNLVDFNRKVATAKEEIGKSRDKAQEEIGNSLKKAQQSFRQDQALEKGLREQAGELAETFKDLRAQAKDLQNIASEVRTLTDKVTHLQETFDIVSSSKLAPELQRELNRSLNAFERYFATLGYTPTTGKIKVLVSSQTSETLNSLAYYDEANKTIVVAKDYASHSGSTLREYAHRVLFAENRTLNPSRSRPEDWSYWSIESGLASYFPCSSLNDPALYSIVNWNLLNQLKFEQHKDYASAFYPGTPFWGGTFWKLRQLLGASTADKLLFDTWHELQGNRSPEEFVVKLLQLYQKSGGSKVREVKEVLSSRGVAIEPSNK